MTMCQCVILEVNSCMFISFIVLVGFLEIVRLEETQLV